MNFSNALISRSTEYSCVIRLCNYFLAVHVKENDKEFISTKVVTDFKVAQCTAISFAILNKISFETELLDLDRPIYTVFKVDSYWYPTELYSDELSIIPVSGSREETIELTKRISDLMNCDFVPQIGITASK